MKKVRLIGENFYNPEPRESTGRRLNGKKNKPVCEEPKIASGRLIIGRDRTFFQPRNMNLGTFTGESYIVRQSDLILSLKNEYLSNVLEIHCKISLPLENYTDGIGRIITVYSVNGKRHKKDKRRVSISIKSESISGKVEILRINRRIVESDDELNQGT